MQRYSNFYKLDKTKPVKFEGHNGKISVVLVIGIVFTVFILAAAIYTFVVNNSFEFQALAAVAFFTCFGLAILGFGIVRQRKFNRNNRIERSLLKNCLCTDAIITDYECIERIRSHDNGSNYYYDVTLSYTFYNEKHEPQNNTFQYTYNYDPEFYEGQWLMVAFNDTDSAILKKFTFVKEDEQRFLKNQAGRSDDDFDYLDSIPVAVDVTRKIRSAEMEYVWLWAALAILVIDLVFTLPILGFALPLFLTGNLFPDIIVYIIVGLISVVFACLFLGFLITYFKKRRKFNKILNNNPNFARGKMFASEKTYRNKSKKEICYCYIDYYGGRHTKTISSIILRKRVQGTPVDTVIMYDSFGNSIPLYSYKLIGED